MSMNTPVLLIAWSSPHIAAGHRCSPARGTYMFIACDGPNPNRLGEDEKVAETRAVIESEIDWPCQIKRLYSDVNQGCRLGVSRAITWFFDQVEEGIILEDDCVPHPDFFTYCTTLLKRYRDDTRVWCISGNNFQKGQWRGDGSYYFSRNNHCWGWASWRRWSHYDTTSVIRCSRFRSMVSIFEEPLERKYWARIWQRLMKVDRIAGLPLDVHLSCEWYHGFANRNLISNVGFGPDGTHTIQEKMPTLIHRMAFLK